ncbi:hypothetical protein QQ045_005274 [Rhodiola kirilowii]
MADPGIPKPPDPGGAQREAADGLTGGRPHIEDIRKVFLSGWNLNNNCSIGAWDARHILIVLDNEGDARKRACVEVDTTSKLPDEVWISTGKDEGFWQRIEFENKLLFCSMATLLSNCRKLKQKTEADQLICMGGTRRGRPSQWCPDVESFQGNCHLGEDPRCILACSGRLIGRADSLSRFSPEGTDGDGCGGACTLVPQTPSNEKQVWTLVQSKKQRKKVIYSYMLVCRHCPLEISKRT